MVNIRVLLLCSSRFALPVLQRLAYMNVLSAVVVPAHCDEWLEQVNFLLQSSPIPVLTVSKKNYIPCLITTMEDKSITLGLMASFSFLLPEAVYSVPIQGFFNIHPGPLPQYRGADPIFQQIKNCEKLAAVTVHYVVQKLDRGAIVLQDRIPLDSMDTYGTVTSNLGQVAARLVTTLIRLILLDVAIPSKEQSEVSANYFKRPGAKEVTIDWYQMDALAIVALINACNPWNKGALTQLDGKIIRLLEAQVSNDCIYTHNASPGKIIEINDSFLKVVAKDNSVLFLSFVHIEEGFMPAGHLKGFGMKVGAAFS